MYSAIQVVPISFDDEKYVQVYDATEQTEDSDDDGGRADSEEESGKSSESGGGREDSTDGEEEENDEKNSDTEKPQENSIDNAIDKFGKIPISRS